MRISAHVHRIILAPPWYVRVLGLIFMLGSLGVYLGESMLGVHRESVVELTGHVFFLVAGMSMFFPEGVKALLGVARVAAKALLALARRTPLLDRRLEPRPPKAPIGPTEP